MCVIVPVHAAPVAQVVSVIPNNDIVPQIDKPMGQINRIECLAGAADCHNGFRSTCEVWHTCGDAHGRDLSSVCDGFLPETDKAAGTAGPKGEL